MSILNPIASLTHAKNNPRVIESGPSSLSALDSAAKGLGWFGLALGFTQLLAPRILTRRLGMQGSETMMRLCGLREIGSGMMVLSPDRTVGLWARVVGDVLDIAALVPALHPRNPQRDNVKLALLSVVGVTLLDLLSAQQVTARRRRPSTSRTYTDRSGFPKGIASARAAAKAHQPQRQPQPAMH